MNISEQIYRLHHNVHRTEQRSATLLHARIFTERRKQAAVKALVLLLQSIDLGRVHVSCAPFSESKATLGNSARRTAHAAQQTAAACHPSMWWQRQCCLSQTSFIKVVTLNNGLVHNTLAVCCCWWLGRRWRRPLAALSPLSGLMNIAETYICLSSATNVNMTQRLLSSVFFFFHMNILIPIVQVTK